MKVFNNHIALFSEKDSINFLDKLKKLVNDYLKEQFNEDAINYSRFTEEKFNKFADALRNIEYFTSSIIDSYGDKADKFNVDEVETAIEEIEDAIQVTKSFSSSNKELIKLVHKALNKFNIIPDDEWQENDRISANEIKSLIKLNSESVNEVLSGPVTLDFDFVNDLCEEIIEEMKATDDNEYDRCRYGEIGYIITNGGRDVAITRGLRDKDNFPDLFNKYEKIMNDKINDEINKRIVSKCDAIAGYQFKFAMPYEGYYIPRALVFEFDLKGLSLDEQLNAINSLKQISFNDEILRYINEDTEFSRIIFDNGADLLKDNTFYDDYTFYSEFQEEV